MWVMGACVFHVEIGGSWVYLLLPQSGSWLTKEKFFSCVEGLSTDTCILLRDKDF